MSNRKCNFGAGPCTLPLEVLQQAQQEFVDFHGAGMSLIEMSHRSKEYDSVHSEAMSLAKDVFGTPDDFEILFLQGGATLQFAMVPMNFLKPDNVAAYVDSGSWASKAISDAKLYGNVYVAWDGSECNYTRMPADSELELRDGTRYLHITSNETIGGIRYADWPNAGVPMISDMSSDFMSRPIPWERFDLVYGGVQKNLAPSGMAVVFIRKNVIEELNQDIGAYLRYGIHAKSLSLYNTPPVFTIYMMLLVIRWMKGLGGLPVIERMADEKADVLYKVIDQSGGFFNCPIDEKYRSRMNIVFRLRGEELERKFLSEAGAAELIGLKGHRSVGGCRASCYNALPKACVDTLAQFMREFQRVNG
ncbi:MAG: 3-phosphoserine/phosphohydroxythreonine transaminase [Gammaproteobacteria bacterium]|nr:3-phosphoserine/phosphohydroxythreonine transaminase [Gammaproteobacteria bacterium]